MEKISELDFVAPKAKPLSILRIKHEFKSFCEKPSDRYGPINTDYICDKENSTMNGFELFSLFTADIIKENVLFSR